MAWIESHQDLRTNPKARRLARILDVPLAQAIGHLHMLWWWAVDHAQDGNLGVADAYDIADAAGWEGDPDHLVKALMECGPADRAGFIECAASGQLYLHDWLEYTAALRASRQGAARGNHNRWHRDRGITDPSCPFCASPPESPPESPPNHPRIAPRDESVSPPESTDLPTNLPKGRAREPDADHPDAPPPDINSQPNQPTDPTRWDTAWTDICHYIRTWPSQDPDRPAPETTFGPRTLTALNTIGGISRIRHDDRPDSAKFDFKDAWQEAARG